MKRVAAICVDQPHALGDDERNDHDQERSKAIANIELI
jgi:hypothetical protein